MKTSTFNVTRAEATCDTAEVKLPRRVPKYENEITKSTHVDLRGPRVTDPGKLTKIDWVTF